MNTEKIKEFEELMLSVDREGVDKLVDYIRNKTDFYKAPASTRYHSCHEGGLLEHSLNVWYCLKEKCDNPIWRDYLLNSTSSDSLIISALLHDICKTNFYVTEFRNKKVYSDNGSKYDSNGHYDWKSVPSYTIDDKSPYGHGEKSVEIIRSFIKLRPVELFAIRWHMGFTEPKENYNCISKAMQMYPLVLALHEADLEATYLLEEEE